VATIRGRFREDATELECDEHFGGLAGFRVLLAGRTLAIIVGVWVIVCFCLDLAVVADAPLADQFHMGGFGFGLLDAAFCAGAIAGAYGARLLSGWRE
jgi:hypothetical protein